MAKASLDYNSIDVADLDVRFWAKVIKTDSCWLWTGKMDDGYGRHGFRNKQYLVHRMVFAVLKEKIIDNLQVDHLCKVRNCLNPEHLEQVTSKENTRRGLSKLFNTDPDLCPYGHDYDVDLPGKILGGPMYKHCSTCRGGKRAKSKS
jgi:hypothetical protein